MNSLNSQPVVSVKSSEEYFSHLPKHKVEILHTAQKDTKLYLPYLYPYSQIISHRLNKNGYTTAVLPQTNAQSLSLGRSITMSKEYLAFTALAGDIMTKAKQSHQQIQNLIPQTEGSEADGMYARVIYSLLPKDCKTKIVTITLETLPFKSKICEYIFLSVLGGDIIMSAQTTQREELLNKLLSCQEITLEYLCKLADDIPPPSGKKIAVVGDPYILYNSFLNEKLLEETEKTGRAIQWMPLSEYLCFLWKKRAETKEEIKIVEGYEKQMQRVSALLGKNSPFAENLDILYDKAQKALPEITGANAAYRLGKRSCFENCQAVLEISSMYENAQTILNLAHTQSPISSLSLSFEGTNDIGARERLQSFLYYIDK